MTKKNDDRLRSREELQRRHLIREDEIDAVAAPPSDPPTIMELKRRKLQDALTRRRPQGAENVPAPPTSREWTTRVTSGGRVVLPADARAALGLTDGSSVRVRLEEGRVTISPIDAIVRDIQNRWRSYIPGERSLVDELIADRRSEAERE